MAAEEFAIATEVAFVQTEDGVVRLEQGDPLPDGVSDDEVARLANGGVLVGFEPVPDIADEHRVVGAEVVEGGVDEIKVRVGTDADTARAYLEAENGRDTPRKTLVAHLQQIIDADGSNELGTEPVNS